MKEMMDKNLMVGFRAPLHEKDTETETYGCRANNPDICANNGLTDICAFASDDGICRRPSKAWKRQFAKLKSEEQGE